MKRRFLLGTLFAALTIAPAFAADPTWQLNGSESSYSYVCDGGDWVAIKGKDNSVTIRGECNLLEIVGSGNKISVEAVSSIRITGNNNDVRYERAPEGKSRPVIKNKGKANTIRKEK